MWTVDRLAGEIMYCFGSNTVKLTVSIRTINPSQLLLWQDRGLSAPRGWRPSCVSTGCWGCFRSGGEAPKCSSDTNEISVSAFVSNQIGLTGCSPTLAEQLSCGALKCLCGPVARSSMNCFGRPSMDIFLYNMQCIVSLNCRVIQLDSLPLMSCYSGVIYWYNHDSRDFDRALKSLSCSQSSRTRLGASNFGIFCFSRSWISTRLRGPVPCD